MSVQILLGLFTTVLLVLLGVIGFFGKRLVEQTDAALAAARHNNEALGNQVVELTADLRANAEEMKKMRNELSTFRRAFHALDRWIYGEAQHGAFKNPPPPFPTSES